MTLSGDGRGDAQETQCKFPLGLNRVQGVAGLNPAVLTWLSVCLVGVYDDAQSSMALGVFVLVIT